eukprot:GHVL01003532.1.p1 GENE.GHVL01003532.1~~GHVL01003532.1.p1  ORF type:complete len:227 (+),score=47.92 GHVL01003532.1:553-1233(+)
MVIVESLDDQAFFLDKFKNIPLEERQFANQMSDKLKAILPLALEDAKAIAIFTVQSMNFSMGIPSLDPACTQEELKSPHEAEDSDVDFCMCQFPIANWQNKKCFSPIARSSVRKSVSPRSSVRISEAPMVRDEFHDPQVSPRVSSSDSDIFEPGSIISTISTNKISFGRRIKKPWQPWEEEKLESGVHRFGEGKWKDILNWTGLDKEGRTSVDCKDKYRNLKKSKS